MSISGIGSYANMSALLSGANTKTSSTSGTFSSAVDSASSNSTSKTASQSSSSGGASAAGGGCSQNCGSCSVQCSKSTKAAGTSEQNGLSQTSSLSSGTGFTKSSSSDFVSMLSNLQNLSGTSA